MNLGNVVNTPAGEIQPYLSPDGLTLYFASNRDGGCGNIDIYMTTRTRLTEHDGDDYQHDEDEERERD